MSVLVLNLRKIQCTLLRIVMYWLSVFPTVENKLLFSRHYLLDKKRISLHKFKNFYRKKPGKVLPGLVPSETGV